MSSLYWIGPQYTHYSETHSQVGECDMLSTNTFFPSVGRRLAFIPDFSRGFSSSCLNEDHLQYVSSTKYSHSLFWCVIKCNRSPDLILKYHLASIGHPIVEMVVRLSSIHNEISYVGKMTSLYWNGPLVDSWDLFTHLLQGCLTDWGNHKSLVQIMETSHYLRQRFTIAKVPRK